MLTGDQTAGQMDCRLAAYLAQKKVVKSGSHMVGMMVVRWAESSVSLWADWKVWKKAHNSVVNWAKHSVDSKDVNWVASKASDWVEQKVEMSAAQLAPNSVVAMV